MFAETAQILVIFHSLHYNKYHLLFDYDYSNNITFTIDFVSLLVMLDTI